MIEKNTYNGIEGLLAEVMTQLGTEADRLAAPKTSNRRKKRMVADKTMGSKHPATSSHARQYSYPCALISLYYHITNSVSYCCVFYNHLIIFFFKSIFFTQLLLVIYPTVLSGKLKLLIILLMLSYIILLCPLEIDFLCAMFSPFSFPSIHLFNCLT